MAFLNKILGVGLGWALGGPIGGILGLIFGSMVDSLKTGQYTADSTMMNGEVGTRPGDFSVSLLILSAAIMKADGKLLRSELEYVKRFFVLQFGEAIAEERIKLFKEILKQDIPVAPVCGQVKQYMDYPSRLQLMHYLFGLAIADNHVDHLELAVLKEIAALMGLPLQRI